MNIRIICILSLLIAHSSSMPITTEVAEMPVIVPKVTIPSKTVTDSSSTIVNNSVPNSLMRNVIRPGVLVNSYEVEIEPNVEAGTFNGKVLTQIRVTDQNTLEDGIRFHISRLSVTSVQFSVAGGPNFINAFFDQNDDDGILEIFTEGRVELYNFMIEYTGSLSMIGMGLFRGDYNSGQDHYLAMNLLPTYARSVFPCIDEPTEETTITFTFKGISYANKVSNSKLDPDIEDQFLGMQGPPHLWGMLAHNFNNLAIPNTGLYLFGPPKVNQDFQASTAMSFFFTALHDWTGKKYDQIERNQDGRMMVFAIPDTDTTWNALSTVCIWEPYVLMEATHSVAQRATALVKIAEAMARQWFGYVLSPENWRQQWVLTGLASHAAYDVVKQFQTGTPDDSTLLDVDALFVTDVIQESLLLDSYESASVLLPAKDIYDESDIRLQINGLINKKAPAIFRMLRLLLGKEDTDFIQLAGALLLNTRALKTVNTQSFYNALEAFWSNNGVHYIDDIEEFLDPYVKNNGYPVINVSLRPGGVLLTKEHFSFKGETSNSFHIVPLTYTTSVNPDFSDVYPSIIMYDTMTHNENLEEEDWILFNIQGQGYYRVNYDGELWGRIIEALYDPERRQEIHPLNRATLVDDALNLARGGKLAYQIAFEIVLTMVHETEYAVWQALVRNMDFLRKQLYAYAVIDEDRDNDVYLRVLGRIMGTFEAAITFNPDPMTMEPAMVSKTRGLVMNHACRSGYAPCIAAAVDWFYDPNNNELINSDIPKDIRPAVYCTMVREEESSVINMLYDKLKEEPSAYERVVILESLACSRDANFINGYLEETIADNGLYNTEERCRIFKAVAGSGYQNVQRARSFLTRRINEVRNKYGGPAKLEEMIFSLVDNMADEDLTSDFGVWINSKINDLDDSTQAAEVAFAMASENMAWNRKYINFVYYWFEENDAPTLITSMFLICVSVVVALFNH